MTCNVVISDVSISCHNPLIHSDHSIISFNLKYEAQFSVRTLPHLVFDYSRADWNGLSDYLMDTDFSTCFGSNDIEFIWLTLKNTIHNAIQLFNPKIKLKSHQHPKWFNAKIRHQLKCLHTLRKKLKLRYSMSKIESYESA